MNTYLAIMVTTLVITQVIRVVQNTIQLIKQGNLYNKQLKDLADCEPTKEDFENKRKAYKLIVEWLENEQKIDEKS